MSNEYFDIGYKDYLDGYDFDPPDNEVDAEQYSNGYHTAQDEEEESFDEDD